MSILRETVEEKKTLNEAVGKDDIYLHVHTQPKESMNLCVPNT